MIRQVADETEAAMELINPRFPDWSPDEWSEIARAKRFMERWAADRDFRRGIEDDPQLWFVREGIDLDPDQVRPLWDPAWSQRPAAGQGRLDDWPRPARLYRQFLAEKIRWRGEIIEGCAPTDPRFRAWRARQMARAVSELGQNHADQVIFDTACYEISKGCSVGCWFCGVDAPRLSDHLYYTPENARLFRGVLETLLELCGPVATQAHFLYWASDPLDNPDYERFCDDFFDVVGTYPLFTTALAHKDPERTRALMDQARGRGARINRFSILTLKQLNQVHAAFTPEELLPIELITLNQESLIVKSNTGRFRKRALKRPEIVDEERAKVGRRNRSPEELARVHVPASIACVSGFLLNLVERTVKLISPCKADDRWPLGYMVFAEGTFTGPADLRRLLARIRDDHMPDELPQQAAVSFRRDLEYRRTESGFEVWTPFGGLRYGGRGRAAYFGDLGELIRGGSSSALQVADRLFDLHGVLPGDTHQTLDRMFQRGLLMEEPPPPAPRLIQLSAAVR